MKPKLFGRWDYEEVTVEDPGLKDYINLKPMLIPYTGGRFQNKRFGKAKIHIIERLAGRLMTSGHQGKKHKWTSGHQTGEKYRAYKIIIKAFEIIEKETKENPLKVFVKAIENAAPREEVTVIEYGGARYPRAVVTSPQRRVDLAIRHMVWGAFHSSRKKPMSMEEALAKEIINAYKNSLQSYAIKKKLELERMAEAAR